MTVSRSSARAVLDACQGDAPGAGLVDAQTLADRLGVSRGWVYENAALLGGLRLGDGPKARLRFDVERAEAALATCSGGRGSQEAESAAKPARPRRRRSGGLGTTVELLPIRGRFSRENGLSGGVVSGRRTLSTAELEQRQAAPVTHGAHSDAQIRPVARAQKRLFLRRNGLKASDLDGIQVGYLDAWACCAAKVKLIDDYVGEHGLLRTDGEPQPELKLYVSLVNSARLSMAKLEEALRDSQRDAGGRGELFKTEQEREDHIAEAIERFTSTVRQLVARNREELTVGDTD